MAMSLENLLAKEGFKIRKPKTSARTSISSEPSTRRLYPMHDQNKTGPSTSLRRMEKTMSDRTQQQSDRVKGTRPRARDDIRREILDRNSKKEPMVKLSRGESWDGRKLGIRSSSVLPDDEIVSELDHYGVETGLQNDERYAEIYSNEVYSPSRSTGKASSGSGEIVSMRNMSGKNIQIDRTCSTVFYKLYEGPKNNKSFNESKLRKEAEFEPAPAEPALDEIAVRAMISILTRYIKRFFLDEEFRASLRHNCFASLNFVGLEQGINTESKVIENLEQAIETVERAAEETATAMELKKASLQLSVITGLNVSDLKDGFTSGIPNSKLSACAHLYLCVIYKLQKKERIAAKHLLQVFCDSPFPARTTLLPELWNDIFLPHLSHLKAWYNHEADSLADAPSKERKLKILEKVYNEIMDSGTYQFAAYYKDWLTEGVEAPSIPSIRIPSVSVREVDGAVLNRHYPDLSNPLIPLSSHPVLSRKLYYSNRGTFDKLVTNQVVEFVEIENYDISRRSSTASVVEDKETLMSLSDAADDKELVIHHQVAHDEDGLIADEPCIKARPPVEMNFNEKFDSYQLQVTEITDVYQEIPYTKVNKLTLQKLAKAVFHMHQTDECVYDIRASSLPDEDANDCNNLMEKYQSRLFHQGLNVNSDYFAQRPAFLSIPEYFICPLSGLFFEEPVTLETGQTFEKKIITEWFHKGHKTCPITGMTLEYQVVPLTNFILKRVIGSWKLEHCRTLLAFASQLAGNVGEHSKFKDEAAVSIVEHLLTFFSRDERIENAKLLISLGGLPFLLERFRSGNLGEKTIVAALLSQCVEADSACRNHIARNIEIMCFVELLHSKQAKSIANAVLLLIELICLNRRKDVCFFLNGLQNKEIMSTMHVLLIYLQRCPSDQRPLVAILLLHLDLLVAPKKYSIYREEAVDAITVALDSSLTDDKIREKCCHALLVLGGRFSVSGKVMTEDCILTKAGFLDCHEPELHDYKEAIQVNCILLASDDEEATEEWLRILSASLLGDRRKPFLETISTCLGSGQLDLVRTCLTTVAWLSSSVASLRNTDLKLSAFSPLISQLSEFLQSSERVEHKILASMSLLNLSRIPECRMVLLATTEELRVPLESLAEVTWTAKELYRTIFVEDH